MRGVIKLYKEAEELPRGLGFTRSFAPSWVISAIQTDGEKSALDAAMEMSIVEGVLIVKKFTGRMEELTQSELAFGFLLKQLMANDVPILIEVTFRQVPDDRVALAMIDAAAKYRFTCISSAWSRQGMEQGVEHMLGFLSPSSRLVERGGAAVVVRDLSPAPQ
jgi:hypothetical protein